LETQASRIHSTRPVKREKPLLVVVIWPHANAYNLCAIVMDGKLGKKHVCPTVTNIYSWFQRCT